ncbi:hypothetical protein SAMN06297280_2381 [Arsukibacterium tuosuense]|uniref:DUF624 domain-containing protein n=1 Tax=Arsukibacterium tuosuense TaxID=1323745 RepID=A0A285IZH5_9GAMM|nr:hypothetical protein [Arsukibacterium tuosuense]SNY53358.1 hypothetical protein SAMN06297280_2381 [Arsukibacterium tuosuense]
MEKPFQLKLIIRRVRPTASLQWLTAAWQLFKQAPLVFIAMFLLTAGISFLLQFNQLTAIAWIFLNPFLTAGFYKAVVGAQQQQKIAVDWLFQPLAEPSCRLILLAIGAIKFLLLAPLLSFHQHLFQTMSVAVAAESGIDTAVILQLIVMVALFTLVFMLFAYAVAIAYFLKEQRFLVVLQTSFIASWRNVTALMLFGLLSTVLVLLTLPTFFIGLVVVLPLLNIAFFLSFNDVFALQVKPSDDGVLEV